MFYLVTDKFETDCLYVNHGVWKDKMMTWIHILTYKLWSVLGGRLDYFQIDSSDTFSLFTFHLRLSYITQLPTDEISIAWCKEQVQCSKKAIPYLDCHLLPCFSVSAHNVFLTLLINRWILFFDTIQKLTRFN